MFVAFRSKRTRVFALLCAALVVLGAALWYADSIGFFDGPPASEDTAVLRVPIPPLPEETAALREETKTASHETLLLSATDARPASQGSYARELLGVRDVDAAVSNPSIACSGGSFERFRCYSNFYTLTVSTDGIEAAFIDLKQRYERGDDLAISQCHQLTHVIGRASTKLYPTVAEAYGHGDSFCWSGYYHGIMEAIIADIGLDQVAERLNDICDGLPGKATYSFDYYNCVHGLGHGVMYVENHDLLNALNTCDRLDGWWERESCYGGAFMENIIANEVDHVSFYLKKDDLLYPCDIVDKPYKQACWLMQTSYMLKELHGDFAQVFDLCASVESPYDATCYESLGRDASGRSVSNVLQTNATCLLGPDEKAREHCVIGAVKDFISYYHSDIEATALCASFFDEDIRTTCLQTARSYYTLFTN